MFKQRRAVFFSYYFIQFHFIPFSHFNKHTKKFIDIYLIILITEKMKINLLRNP